MKRSFILLYFFILFTVSAFAHKTHFKISYDPEYAPFSYKQQGKPYGLLIDIWELWAQKNNYTIEFVNAKFWDNAIDLAKNKKVDFFLGTEAHENWMYGSDEIYKAKTSLFKYISKNTKNISKTRNYKIGIVGSDYEQSIQNQFINAKITIYKDYKSVLKDIMDKKIDFLYDDRLAVKFYVFENRLYHLIRPIDEFSTLSPIQAISHSKELIDIFNRGFKKLNIEELIKIEKKWIISDKLYFEDDENKKQHFSLSDEEKEFIQKHTLEVSISKAWKPFSFLNNNKPDGISSDFWEYIAKKNNLKVNYHFSSIFTEQLEAIKDKELDLIYSTGITKERERYALFSKPYISFPLSIATLKDENFIENANSLIYKKIAVGENFTAHKMLKDIYPTMDFVLVSSIKEGLEKVSNKEAFAYVDIQPTLSYNINKLGFKDLKITGNTGLEFELRVMVRDDYPLLVSIINKTIDSMDEIEKNKIISKWSNIQFEERFDHNTFWKIFIFISIIILALSYRYFMIRKLNRSLKKTVEERTKELKSLNENLETLVEEKTKEIQEINSNMQEAQKIAHLGNYKHYLKTDTLYWSDEHYRIFGLEPIFTTPTYDLYLSSIHPDDKEKVLKNIEYVKRTDKTLRFEYRLLLKNKKIKYVESTARVKRDKNGEIEYIEGTILDMTSLKILELEKRKHENLLAQQSKMAAMGEMLENIAHQWRQPLSLISTSSTAVQLHHEMNTLDDKVISSSMEKINEASQYLSKTIDDFRNFFSTDKKILRFNLNDVIDKCLLLLSSKIENNQIKIVKQSEDIYINTLESELIQVIMNLIKNSIDALEDKEGKRFIFIDIIEEKSIVILKIKDNGGGIEESIKDRIFEPYFTTKHKSQGTGIGLYMSLEIVTKHIKGDMNVKNVSYTYENSEYKGALFTIYIPKELKD